MSGERKRKAIGGRFRVFLRDKTEEELVRTICRYDLCGKGGETPQSLAKNLVSEDGVQRSGMMRQVLEVLGFEVKII